MGFQHHITPKKAKVKGIVDYLKARGIPYFKSDIFRFYGVGKTRGWAILSENDTITGNRTYYLVFIDRRGRK